MLGLRLSATVPKAPAPKRSQGDNDDASFRPRRSRLCRDPVPALALDSPPCRRVQHPPPLAGTPAITLSDTTVSCAYVWHRFDLTDRHQRLDPQCDSADGRPRASISPPSPTSRTARVPAVPSAPTSPRHPRPQRRSIWVQPQRQAGRRHPLAHTVTTPTTYTVTLTFDPNHPLVITRPSRRLAIDFNLALDFHNTATTPPTAVRPSWCDAGAVDPPSSGCESCFVTAQSGSSDFTINFRPLIDLSSALVRHRQHHYADLLNINGVAIRSGVTHRHGVAPGKHRHRGLVTLGILSGSRPAFHATSVYSAPPRESSGGSHRRGRQRPSRNTLNRSRRNLPSPVPSPHRLRWPTSANNASGYHRTPPSSARTGWPRAL